MADEPILATLTGEHFQLVRLHYRVFNHRGLLRAFTRLRCLDYDPTQSRCFCRRKKGELLLGLRSRERATAAIELFDRHIGVNRCSFFVATSIGT